MKKRMYLLNTDSKLNPNNPESNEFVKDWGENTSYLLMQSSNLKKPFIVSGSGKGYDEKEYGLFDDGNQTTRFARQTHYNKYDEGTHANVLAKATSIEELKSFPKGNYQLYVMK